MKFTNKTLYTFDIIIGIALIIGFLELNSYSYAFSEKNVSDKTTTITPKLLSNLYNSNIPDSKMLLLLMACLVTQVGVLLDIMLQGH